MRRFVVIIFLTLLSASCAVSERVVYEDSEGVVPDDFFSTVKKNKTTKDWIVGNLGQPRTVDELGQVEVYTDHLEKARYSKVSVLLVLNRGVVEEEAEYYHVMLCNDIVEKAWFDEYSSIQTQRYAKKSDCYASDHERS